MSTNQIEFTQDEANEAAQQEENERLTAENQHLKNRVVLLRAMVNRLQKEAKANEAPEQGEPVIGEVVDSTDDNAEINNAA